MKRITRNPDPVKCIGCGAWSIYSINPYDGWLTSETGFLYFACRKCAPTVQIVYEGEGITEARDMIVHWDDD